MKITAVIPAHNEAELIANTITNLRAANPDSIIVIADGCTDSTAQLAEESGAIVFQRNALQTSEVSQTSEVLGKGGALRWLFTQDLAGLQDPRSLVVIFDADSTVNLNFFTEVRRAFENGALVTQSFVSPVIPTPRPVMSLRPHRSADPAPTLAAYSEILSQVYDDALRSRLNWGVPLRGTGMAFRLELLRQLLPHVHTHAEDIELSLLLAQRGVCVKFLREAIVYDPKPPDAARVSRQRARWLQGQMQVWRSYWKTILRLSLRGAEMGWLLSALLLKPKTFFVALKIAICILVLIFSSPIFLKSLFTFLVVVEVSYYLFGLLLIPSPDRSRYGSALLRSPLYFFVWLHSVIIAMRERSGWLSARHE